MHILLVEDDGVIARELQTRWMQRGIQVTAVGTLDLASMAVADAGVDLVVLDLGLPDGDGLQWLASLRQRDSTLPVLILTARDRVADRVRGLKSGADDYLVKPFAIEELDARVEVLIRRTQRDADDSAQFGSLRWSGSQGIAELNGVPMELSPREFQVLGILVRRAPRLVAKRVLIDELSERNLEMGDSAVEVYVSRLRRKLAQSDLQIRTMRGFGYLLVHGEAGGDRSEPS